MKPLIKLLCTLLCFALGANALYAVSGTWDQTKSGNWSATANWSGAVIADGANNTATFPSIAAAGVTRTITLDTSRTIGSLAFTPNNRTYVLTSSGGSILTLDNSAGTTPPLVRSLNSGGCSVNLVLAGTGGIRSPDQVGTMTLGGANTYSGDTEICRGVVKIANVSALPSGSRTGNINFTNYNATAGTLDLNANSITINGLVSGSTAGGLGIVTSSAAGAVTLTVGDNNATGTFYGVIQNGSGTVSLTKIGSGTESLAGVNIYTGTTTISGGTLALTGSGAVSSSSTINLGGSGTLDVSGVSAPPYAITTGKTLNGSGATGTIQGGLTLNSGALLTLTYATGTPTINVASGTLTLTANATTVTVTGSPLVNGSYKLISKSGGGLVAGTVGSVTVGGLGIAGGGSAALAISGDELYLNVTGGATALEWGSGDGTWEVGTSGWGSGGSTTWADGDLAEMTDTYSSGNPTITLNTEVLPQGVVVNSTKTYTISGTGDIGGTSDLRMVGPGTLTLDVANAHTGGSTLYAGTLNLKNASALGGATGTFTINGGTLDNTKGSALTTVNYPQAWNGSFVFTGSSDLNLGTGNVTLNTTPTVTVSSSTLTVGGIISGTSGLTKAGAGTLTLNAANTFSGDTRITSGSLLLGDANALQNSAYDLNIADSGTLSFGTLTAATFGNLKGNSISGARTLVLANASSAPVTLTVGNNNAAASFVGILSGGTVTKIGTGTWTVGNADTTKIGCAGDLTISAGRITQNSSGTWPSGAGNGNVVVNSPGIADFGSRPSGSMNGLSGNGTVTKGSSGAYTFTLGNNDATAAFSGVIQNGSGTISLVKAGLGTQTLSGINAYSGTTAVNAGALVVNSPGSLASGSAVTVAANATLGGSGTVNGATTVSASGILAPGVAAASSGTTLTLPGTVSLNASCIVSNRINKSGVTLTADKVNKSAGTLTLAGTLKVVLESGSDALAKDDTFDLIDGTIAANTLTYNLPSLPTGLVWDTSQLNAGGNGTIKVSCSGTLVANAGADPDLCSGFSAVIGGSPTASGGSGSGYTYSWSPAAGLSDATAANPTASPATTTIYTVTVTDSVGCTAQDSVTVTAPLTTVSTQPVSQTVCSGSAATFSVTASGPGTFGYSWAKNDNSGWGSAWAVSGSGGTFRATSTGNDFGDPACTSFTSAFDINSPSGNAMGMWGGASGTTVGIRTFAALAVGQVVSIDFDNGNVDSGKQVGFSLETSGGADVLQFYFLGGAANYKYWDTAGLEQDSGIGFQRTGLRVQFALTSASTYSLIVTPCGGTTTKFSGSYTGTIAQLKLFNQNTSGGGDYDIYFNNFLVGGYTDNADNYSGDYAGLDKGNQPIAVGNGGSTYTTPTLTVGDSGTQYQVVVSSCGGAALSSPASVTVNPPATVDAGVDQTVCASSPTVTLAGIIGGAATSATWSGGAGTFIPNNTTLNATYTPTAGEITAGSVTLTLTTDDPAGPCGAVNDSMLITINPAATVNAGPDQAVCANSPTVILAGTKGGAATSATWSGGAGTFTPDNVTLNATYTPTPGEITAGSVTLTLTTDDPPGLCNAVNDSMLITIRPSPTAAVGADKTVCAGSPVAIGGSPTASGGTGPYTYSWSPATGLSDATAANPTATVGSTTTYTVTVTDANGCAGIDSVAVNVIPQPVVESTTLVGSDVVMVWSSLAGQTYRVQYTTVLPDPPAAATWTDLTPDVTAGGATATYTDVAAPAPRYYRIKIVCP